MENLKNYLFELCSESAPSGSEQLLTSLEKIVTPFADKVYNDNSGNLIAVKYSRFPNPKKLMLDAHADEVSLIVTGIDDAGFIHFVNNAGIDSRILPASTVTVLGKSAITGIVATLPPHLLKDADTKKIIKHEDMVIDIGFSAKKTRELVRVGDMITLRSSCAELKNNLVMGKSFDNRASCAVIIDVLSKISRLNSRFDVYAVFSAGEEFGGFGVSTAAFDIAPDRAIVLDTTFGVSPYTSSSKGKKLGQGAAIGISPLLDNHMKESLVGIARSRSLDYQTEVMSGGTGTNADDIVMSRSGVATALLSIPLRYMHSASEVVSLEDMKSASALVSGYIERGGDNE